MSSDSEWYLKKKNNTQYGPVNLEELVVWARQCRIVAGNQASQDQQNWIPVEDIPALQMDWFAKRRDGKQYGPFPLPAVSALVDHNVLPDDAILTHRSDDRTMTMEEALKTLSAGETSAPPGRHAPNQQKQPTDPMPLDPEPSQEDAKQETETNDLSDKKEMEITQLKQEIKKYQKQIRVLAQVEENHLATAKQEAQKAKREMDQLREEHAIIQTKAANQLDEARAQQVSLAKKVEQLEQALANAQATNKKALEETPQQEERIAELRQQVAFMKKNIAVLHAQLAESRETAAQRAKLLAGALVAITLVTAGSIVLILTRGCSPAPAPDHVSRPDATRTAEAEALPPIADRSTDLDSQESSNTPITRGVATLLPEIRVDGIYTTHQDDDRLSIRFAEGVFSSLDTLSSGGRELLDALARQLPRNLDGWKLIIEGHTDDIPLRSTARFANNEALAMARAERVTQHLQQRAGFPESRLEARAGSSAPYPNNSSENRVRNRTVTIQIKRH